MWRIELAFIRHFYYVILYIKRDSMQILYTFVLTKMFLKHFSLFIVYKGT